MTRSRLLLLVAAISGATFALAAPPTNLFPVLWLGMAGLAWTLHEDVSGTRLRRWLPGALRGLFFGAAANMVALRFVPDVIARFTPLPWVAGLLALVLLGFYQGLRFAAGAVVTLHLQRHGVPRFLAFGMGILASTFVPVVFPWTAAGGVTPWPVMVQLADLIGERGVTFLMALSAGMLAEAARHVRDDRPRAAKLLALALGLPVLTALHGMLRMASVEDRMAHAPHAHVSLVQPMTEASERWDSVRAERIVTRLTELTKSAEKTSPDLVVWPEGAFPYPLSESTHNDLEGVYSILQPGVHGPVLAGVMMRARAGGEYNAVVLADHGQLSPAYDKMHLLAFGEAVPFADTIPWLKKTFAKSGGIVAGSEQRVFTVGAVRAAVLICFEDNLPEAGREAAAMDPNLLVNVTNDAWFFGSAEGELHLRLAALRSVEHRRDMVRAVNRGPTSWVDAAGRVRARWPAELAGALKTEPALLEGATVYGRFGDVPVLALSLLVAFALVLRARTRHKNERAPGL